MKAKEKLIYLAGIIDGEGTFWVGKGKNGQGRTSMNTRIIVTNTNTDLMSWLKENYGGYVGNHKQPKPHHTQCFVWGLGGKKAVELAHLLTPYLIVKKEQVKRLTRVKYDNRGWIIKDSVYL